MSVDDDVRQMVSDFKLAVNLFEDDEFVVRDFLKEVSRLGNIANSLLREMDGIVDVE